MALEVSSERFSHSLFDDQKQSWKHRRHWYLPPEHTLLKVFRYRAARGAEPEALMHGSLLKNAGSCYLREVNVNGQHILPAGAAIEVICVTAFCGETE